MADFEDAIRSLASDLRTTGSQMNWLSTQVGNVDVAGWEIPASYGVGRSGDDYIFVIIDEDEPTHTRVKAAELRDALSIAERAYAAQPRLRPIKKAMGCTIDSTLGPLEVSVKKNTLLLSFPTTMQLTRTFMGKYNGTETVSSRYNLYLGRFKTLLGWCDRHPQPTRAEREAGAYAATSV